MKLSKTGCWALLGAYLGKWARWAVGPLGMGNPRPMALIRDVTIETQSPRMGVLSDGATRVAARGSLSGYSSAGRYDVVASPAIVDGELTLAVGDVMDAAEPLAPGLT